MPHPEAIANVHVEPLVWIKLRDGVRLAARLWLPGERLDRPVPAILEYLPYRLRDGTVLRDGPMHTELAAGGFACLRVDMRGSGDSDGVLVDEYLQQEQDDAIEVIAWIARQPWCNGAVGMMGISWGGFNALQVAARRPPALKAIVSVASVVDRYRDDTHYSGGCLLGGNLGWGATFFAMGTRPPDPLAVGDRWRDLWRARLEGMAQPVIEWMRHPLRDDYWRHGSIAEDYGAIEIPVLAVSGWEDAYTNAVFHLVANSRAPCRGLIGPWPHSYPNLAHLQPIDFLGEVTRWFDHWLKGIDSGMLAEPPLRLWLQDGVRPSPRYTSRPGRWIGESGWPSPSVQAESFALAPGRLGVSEAAKLVVRSPITTGVAAGVWCPYGFGAEMPTDQREEDGCSLCFDTDPLTAPIEVIGFPEVELTFSVDRETAMVAARLCELFPDGASTRVTYGLLSLNHVESDAVWSALDPGRRYRVRLSLKAIGHRFLAGNRLRLALSTSYWPMAWPAPDPTTITVYTENSRLVLPVRRAPADESPLRPFAPPLAVGAKPALPVIVTPGNRTSGIENDLVGGARHIVIRKDRGRLRFSDGLDVSLTGEERYSITTEGSTGARQEARWHVSHARGNWSARAETWTSISSDSDTLHIESELSAFDGGARFAHRTWNLALPRRGRRSK